jgi:hypothetical protein
MSLLLCSTAINLASLREVVGRAKEERRLTRFHGVFAPNSKHRAEVIGDGKEKQHPHQRKQRD